jgi:hypothetical protein
MKITPQWPKTYLGTYVEHALSWDSETKPMSEQEAAIALLRISQALDKPRYK